MFLPLLLACTAPADDPVPTEPRVDKVVIIVLDGVRVEETFGEGTALDGASSDSILPKTRAALFPLAARVVPATQTGATSTTPGHCDLLAGRNVPHGHFSIVEAEGVGDYIPEWPTFIQAFLDADPARWALITGDTPHTEGLAGSAYPGETSAARFENTAEAGLAAEDDAEVVDTVVARIRQEAPPDFILANLHAMDTRGHVDDADGYMEGVRALDTQLLRIWKALGQDPDYAGRTVMVVTSDHGRHSTGDEVWTGHGDACTGCRSIPILLLGPGVKPGTSVDTAYALIDLAPTLSALVGAPLPFAEGLVMRDLLEDPAAVVDRTGSVELEGSTVEVELLAEPGRRSRVVADGVELSAAGAMEARGPVAVPDGSFVCWRELAAAGEVYWPWVAECAERSDAGWTPVAFATEGVDPWWRPALAPVDGATWAAWVDNPSGGVPTDDEPPVPVRLTRRIGGAWGTGAGTAYGFFPTAPSLVATGAEAGVLAFAGSDSPRRGRYTRKIRVYAVDWALDTPAAALSEEQTFDLSGEGMGRQERPALYSSGEGVELAFLASGAGETRVYRSVSVDGGRAWSAAVDVSPGLRVLPTLAPVWDSTGRLWWAAVGEEGEALLCNLPRSDTSAGAAPADTAMDTAADPAVDTAGAAPLAAPVCEAVGSPRIGSLTAAGSGVRFAIDTGVGRWETSTRE